MIFGPPPPQPTGYLDLIKEENRHQEAMQCAAYRQVIADLQVRVAELERELAEAAREVQVSTSDNKSQAADERALLDQDGFPRDACLLPTPEQLKNARNKIPEKLTTGLLQPQEPAPAEPTLREFLVEFRKWVKGEGDYEVGGCVADRRLAEWIDARLGKEESDG